MKIFEVVARDKMKYHADDRAERYLNVFPLEEGHPLDKGQINVSFVATTDHVVAWHRHKYQTDFWCCLKGSFKVGLATTKYKSVIQQRVDDVKFEYLTSRNPRVLEIKPGVYHGFRALEPNSILLYFVTRKWDGTDEERAAVGSFGEDWGVENK